MCACVCSCYAVCLEVRGLCAAVHVGACAPAVLCAGTCLRAAVCRCVLCAGACAGVCRCVHVHVRMQLLCCVQVRLLCRHWSVCVLRLDLLSQTRVRVCSVFVSCMRARSIMERTTTRFREGAHHTGSLSTHTAPIHPLTLYFHSRRRTRVCTHVGWCTWRGEPPSSPPVSRFSPRPTSVASDSHTRHRSISADLACAIS